MAYISFHKYTELILIYGVGYKPYTKHIFFF
jgi:hypothetical protein